MIRLVTPALCALALSVSAASAASAQGVGSTAIQKARNAKAASDQQTAAMQQTGERASAAASNQPASKPPASTQPVSKSAPAGAAHDPSAPATPAAAVAANGSAAKPDTAGPPPTIYRESFVYARDGRRDPFVSLLTTNDLRPTLSDLRLTGVLFDHSGRGNSLATLRDRTTNAQYRVGVGSVLGRMRVSAIRTETVVFTIEEFGTTRRDSLSLRDSTNKARGK